MRDLLLAKGLPIITGMAESTVFRLKKPFVIWALGVCFLFAPPANMAAALFMGNVSNWYVPSLWLGFFVRMDLAQQIFAALFPVAGISLLVQRKTSWLFAIVLLICGCVNSLYTYFTQDHLVFPVVGPLLVNGTFCVVLFYFRFPYLDRRDQILRGVANRYPLLLPIRMDNIEGVSTENLSRGGCFLKFPAGRVLPAVNSHIRIQLNDIHITCLVLRHDKNGCAVKFESPARIPRSMLRQVRKRFSKAA